MVDRSSPPPSPLLTGIAGDFLAATLAPRFRCGVAHSSGELCKLRHYPPCRLVGELTCRLCSDVRAVCGVSLPASNGSGPTADDALRPEFDVW
ncbi:hypothetical protein J6590_064422 [Homalodisca vitripennis]|nr:hypothetical protein J6590_064422 [Homalodisca vitripennis]